MVDVGVEARCRALFMNNIAGVGLSTPAGQVVDCNDAFIETFGFTSRSELLGRSAWDFYLCRQDRDDAIQQERVRENHVPEERPFRHKTGRPIWLRFTRTVVSRINNRPELLLVTAMDVTELRRLRAQVRGLPTETSISSTLGSDPTLHGLAGELTSHLQTVNLALGQENLQMLTRRDLQEFIKSVERMKILMEDLVMNQVNVDSE